MPLLTGSEGYVGTHLKPCLTSAAKTYTRFDIKLGNDVADYHQLVEANAKRHHDLVYHLASYSNRPESKQQAMLYYRTMVGGTINVIQLCKEYDHLLVFPSTHWVKTPSCPYDHAKAIGERMVQDSGVASVILRFHSIFDDEGSDPNRWHLVPKMHDMAKEKGVIEVWKPNEMVQLVQMDRALSYYMDYVKYIGLIVEVQGLEYRIGDLAKQIAARYKAKVKVIEG